MSQDELKYILAFDTSNEVIALGLGRACAHSKDIEIVYSASLPARRQSNTQLLPHIDSMLSSLQVSRKDIACVCVGRGPGSFTGVRIAMATAKGIASALGVALVGVSTQEAIAQGVKAAGYKGKLLVASDAMRKEIYPAFFEIGQSVLRLTGDAVVKCEHFLQDCPQDPNLMIAGDALLKYSEAMCPLGSVVPQELWTPSGAGLLLVLEDMWKANAASPFDACAHDPISVLPIYTRLSDAEEAERRRLAKPGERNLITGVCGNKASGVITEDMAPIGSYDQGIISYRPLDVRFSKDLAQMEAEFLGSDAWNESMVADDISRADRSWWMATLDGKLVGYAGARVAPDTTELLKVVVRPEFRRRHLAKNLIGKVAYDALNLASTKMTLEVRESNIGAQEFYKAIGFEELGKRPKYYSDGEDALIYSVSLPLKIAEEQIRTESHMEFDDIAHPIILAIESSCDETAACVIDGQGRILSNVVSSQIDFHARFGGVVPEIASRKHVEAIVGVARLALQQASAHLTGKLDFKDLDAVGVTYAPGLVGALVVGVAFAKGVAWAMNIPLVAVNHLEGHLYANKLVRRNTWDETSDLCSQGQTSDVYLTAAESDLFEFPAVVSLVSGGNTMLVLMRAWQDYQILGETIDDAVGEAFDKVAKAMGFPYPGGPQISRLAKEGNPLAIDYPRALMYSGDYRFSLSGLKTAVITYISREREAGRVLNLADICASFQQAVIDVQVDKAKRAILENSAKTFCLGGGVAANAQLRQSYEEMCAQLKVSLIMPPLSACGDNAAMIALVALDRYKQGKFAPLDQDAFAHADLSKPY